MTQAACPLCGAPADTRLLYKSSELAAPVARLLRQRRSAWRPSDRKCPTCALGYARRVASERSPESLHTTTDPHTTFPYYHPDEETVAGQAERLPDHTGFNGAGVTITFLDSGYYPHPDLTASTVWPNAPEWASLNARQWRAALQRRSLRLHHYADLTGNAERIGLDQSSLWDGAGDSWHGQMATAIAAGNGLLSQGRYRGYAHGADILAMKIGRGGGRIPEEDILSGLNWLLHDDRWQEHNVRVLNVSVGGDFDQAWRDNPVCLAAEELARRGVFIAAAAGNSHAERLLAPAQSPAVMTVGGVDDHNQFHAWGQERAARSLDLYPHNWGIVTGRDEILHKPEVLALGRWLPSPILPVNPVFREMHAIDALRHTLEEPGGERRQMLLEHWHRTLHLDQLYVRSHPADSPQARLAAMWQALRKRMNAHKWIHAYYQHVDGTSVAVAQVSAVAAQMLQANPQISPGQIRSILTDTALPLPHLPASRTGAGLLQPAAAVAAALRAPGGPLRGFPVSGSLLCELPPALPLHFIGELHETPNRARFAAGELREPSGRGTPVYFGLLAPQARSVSLIGTFNAWQPERLPLSPAGHGWWHAAVMLPPGRHLYRFWVTGGDQPEGDWHPDPETMQRAESGYAQAHSAVEIMLQPAAALLPTP